MILYVPSFAAGLGFEPGDAPIIAIVWRECFD